MALSLSQAVSVCLAFHFFGGVYGRVKMDDKDWFAVVIVVVTADGGIHAVPCQSADRKLVTQRLSGS